MPTFERGVCRTFVHYACPPRREETARGIAQAECFARRSLGVFAIPQLAARSHARPETRALTGVERTFGEDEIIVSKTDLKGIITYANRVFLRVAQYHEHEVLGKPHNIIRHPDMPRGVFQLLWDTIQDGREIFAYVLNRSRSGDHYWVLAHVTPTFGPNRRIVGYHSNRRLPRRTAIEKIQPLYAMMLNEEQNWGSPRDAARASLAKVTAILQERRQSYDEFVFSL